MGKTSSTSIAVRTEFDVWWQPEYPDMIQVTCADSKMNLAFYVRSKEGTRAYNPRRFNKLADYLAAHGKPGPTHRCSEAECMAYNASVIPALT